MISTIQKFRIFWQIGKTNNLQIILIMSNWLKMLLVCIELQNPWTKTDVSPIRSHVMLSIRNIFKITATHFSLLGLAYLLPTSDVSVLISTHWAPIMSDPEPLPQLSMVKALMGNTDVYLWGSVSACGGAPMPSPYSILNDKTSWSLRGAANHYRLFT